MSTKTFGQYSTVYFIHTTQHNTGNINVSTVKVTTSNIIYFSVFDMFMIKLVWVFVVVVVAVQFNEIYQFDCIFRKNYY